MSRDVVSDAGPLIALARAGELDLLRRLYGRVLVPPRVLAELCLAENRPGARTLAAAFEAGWLCAIEPELAVDSTRRARLAGAGEEEAIQLAKEQSARFVLIDERRGRQLARKRGLPVVGTGGVLLAAKKRGMVEKVAPVIEELIEAGYRFSQQLERTILEMAGEAQPGTPSRRPSGAC